MTLPTGTVTFLRSDIEASMEHARALGARYDELNAEHAGLVRAAVAEHGGEVVRTEGDAFFAVFSEAGAAARAAVDIQRTMAEHPWPPGHALALRIGLHTGAATRAGDDYGGFEVNRAARVAAVGHGGQIVLSDPTRALIAADLPAGWRIDDLGRVRLKGVAEPEHLFGLLAPGLAATFEPLRSEGDLAEHLPQRLSSFIGRETELAELEALLADTRLLTLVGPGGTGKTTLALELARREAHRYRDGAWFVDLQAVTDPAEVKPAIAHALGLLDGAQGPAADRLDGFVKDRSMLLVVDNFEQVGGSAGVLADLLAASTASRCFVTSRIPLRLAGEQAYAVRPLGLDPAVDDEEPEAVRLLVERVRRAHPSQSFGPEELLLAWEICRLLDGLPLAIELAAARASVLPLPSIRDRLRSRLPLPGAGPRDLPARQRTMESTVAWSYGLLEPPARHLLACLSVFAESFELQQVEDVCGPEDLAIDVLEGLFELTQQSLLQRIDDPVGGVRFRMLETIASFARARLEERGDAEAVQARHAKAYAELTAANPVGPWAMGRAASLDRLEADDENLGAAFAWLVEREEVQLALPMLAGLWRYWVISGRLRARLPLAEAALRLPGARQASPERAMALDAIGGLHYWAGDLDTALECYEQQLAVAREVGDRAAEAEAYYNMSFGLHVSGDHQAGVAAVDAAESIFRELEDDPWLIRVEWSRGLGLTQSGTRAQQRAAMVALAERLAPLEDPISKAQMLQLRAQIALLDGDGITATRLITKALHLAHTNREFVDIIIALQPVAMGTLQIGEPELGALLIGISDGEAERYGIMRPASMAQVTGVSDPERPFIEALGPEGYEAAVARGRRLTLADALELLDAQCAAFGPSAGVAD